MSDSKLPCVDFEDVEAIQTTLMTLRKPTELKKVIDSVPKPVRAVPKYGLPLWYKLGLECKLPVPKMPAGKIIFARGRIGEDVRRVGLGIDGKQTFDLTDPYCNNVSYEYVAMHDPHLAHHFAQKPARKRMQHLGFCTQDGRAICTLKEFNQYRKYLYNRYMDRIHITMQELDERARDELILRRVEEDVLRKEKKFLEAEKAREQLKRWEREHAEELEAKKQAAIDSEKKIKLRMALLEELKEKQRKESIDKAAERQNRIKQRVLAAAEIELRRKITMVRAWRANEKKRLERLRLDREMKKKRLEEQANNKWIARIQAQNARIQEEQILLKLYTEDMRAAAARREKKVQIKVYNNNLELQKIRLANWKSGRGGQAKTELLAVKLGAEFERCKRGVKGMTAELGVSMAKEALKNAMSTKGDRLMTLGTARASMETFGVLPSAPISLLQEMLESAIIEFTRRKVHTLFCDVEAMVYEHASEVFFSSFRPQPKGKGFSRPQRWTFAGRAIPTYTAQSTARGRSYGKVGLGSITSIRNKCEPEEGDPYMSTSLRRPTPMPSMFRLLDVVFSDRIDDYPVPTTHGRALPERSALLKMVNITARLLTKAVSDKVSKGMDLITCKVTLPCYIAKHPVEWGEAIESVATALVDNRIRQECKEITRTSEFLAHRILKALSAEMKYEKKLQKTIGETLKALNEGEKKEEEKKDEEKKDEVKEGEAAVVKI